MGLVLVLTVAQPARQADEASEVAGQALEQMWMAADRTLEEARLQAEIARMRMQLLQYDLVRGEHPRVGDFPPPPPLHAHVD